MAEPPDDPHKTMSKLHMFMSVSARIQNFAVQRKRNKNRLSENVLETLQKSKNDRAARLQSIGAQQRYVLELVAEYLEMEVDQVVEHIIDSSDYVQNLESLFSDNGNTNICFFYKLREVPSKESGRYNPHQNHEKIMLVSCAEAAAEEIAGTCVVAFRMQSAKAIEMKNLSEDVFVSVLNVPDGDNLITTVKELLENTAAASIKHNRDYGGCKEPQRKEFIDGFEMFLKFLRSTEYDIKNRIIFEVSHDLYKGHLLVPHQIVATAKDRERIKQVEQAFNHWMRQIQVAITEGTQIRQDPPDVGPLNELEYWRSMLTKYASIVEFVGSRPFRNFLTCLTLSSSKLVKKWNDMDNEVTICLNEARDNVRYMSSIQKFWDPLYRLSPPDIAANLPTLLATIRSVFQTSRFYNTSDQITGFLAKVTNQIIISCQNFLTNYRESSIWWQKQDEVLEKIDVAYDLCLAYRTAYNETTREMEQNPNEKRWDCSEIFIFTKLNTFEMRLNKLKLIMNTMKTYQILNRVRISGTETFSNIIKDAYEVISTRKYDALAHRLKDFDSDFDLFFKQIEIAEFGLQKYVKDVLEPIPTVTSRMLVLSRYEKLQLNCLCLDRRYLDVAQMLEHEIENVKDYYNEDRSSPCTPWCIPPSVGRMMWARCMLRKMEEPIKVLRTKRCVVEHPKAQLCIKYFNYLASVLLHYKLLHHKAWFDYVEQVRNKLELPVLRRDPKNRWLLSNLHPYVLQVIKETETVWKMEYDVPTTAKILVFCKDKVLEALEQLKALVKRNNELRLNIPIVFLPIMRTMLVDLDSVIDPGLSTITWLSLNLDRYLSNVDTILSKLETFLKSLNDIRTARIEEPMEAIEFEQLVFLPSEPIEPAEFYDLNIKHRQAIEQCINQKSIAIERAVVEMINRFVDIIEVADVDEQGRRKFQLPPTDITVEDRRAEEQLPIDKYDWIRFGKVFNATTYPTLDVHQILCFKDYEYLKYEVNHLHFDCMELFAYYTNMMTSTLVKCTRRSLEMLKKRANVLNFREGASNWHPTTQPFLITHMELTIPKCVINLSLPEINEYFENVRKNIVEINLKVATWGKQAKTIERKLRRPMRDETYHDKNWFRHISENKEIERYMRSFEGGLVLLSGFFDTLLKKTYDQFKYLWAEDRDEQISAFVATNPLTADIRDKFIEYDRITETIENLRKTKKVGPIEVDLENVNNAILLASKEWKTILGKKLSEFYKIRLSDMVEFIQAKEKILDRELRDLDDVRLAMDCLQSIRENFLSLDMDLTLMEETYALFNNFHISIPVEDMERVDGLRYNFKTMIKNSEQVQDTIIALQQPLQVELTEGVANFNDEVLEFDRDYDAKGPMVDGIPANEASDRVLLFQGRFDDLWGKFEKYASGERLFGLPVNDYLSLHKKKKEFNLLSKLYSLYLQVMKNIDEYYEIPWLKVDIEKINGELTDFQNRCRRLPKGMQNWPAYIDLKKKIDDFNNSCPLLELMTNDAMKERHWTRMETLLKQKFDVANPNFSLGDVMQAPLLKFKDDIEDICVGAVKEKDIESKLKTIISEWASISLQFAMFKTRGEVLIKPAETSEIVLALEDSLMVMNSLASNRFNAPFKKDILLWLAKLVNTGEILEKWLIVQNLWIYLEAVFVGGDISKQLPAEAKRFMNIDKAWMRIMFKARDNPIVVSVCTDDDVVSSTLTHLLEQLEACQKSLSGYLESKRLVFPRFFFISDPVLLEILGQSSDPTSIQGHLLSLFDAVAQVEFDGDNIVALMSANGERVPLEKPVVCMGGVENWLGSLLTGMQESIKGVLALMAQNLNEPDFDFLNDFQKFCGQAGLVGVQLLWTHDAEIALKRSRKDRNIMRVTNQRFLDLLNSLISLTIKNLTKLERIEFETMVTIHVHQRDIFDELVKKRVRNVADFEWQKQARFYYIYETDDIIVKITDVDFIYQNEYLGVTERLCITPLTDRCYITLAQAIGMCMGGAPAGPAGTGKTETTKDMGRALGKLVVVFNCSDQMDFRGLGRIYKGLAQSGSWGCFDEFNRIELPVLSVAAQQINIVLTARKEKKTHFIFSDGDTVSLNREFGLFITMNPGYAGRQELPENLKIQFRSVAMMVPDRQIIIRVKLASCGFIENVVLARKFFTLYKLCEEQLSKQVHYDFGLRNILSVLRTLGAQKRAHPEDSEETIVMRVLRDMNVSKLVDEDEPLFISLIEDLFPGIKLSTSTYKDLQKAITTSVESLGLVNHPEWNLKLIQLYETSLVRHGLMVLGPTGAGKTTCIHTLLRSFTECGQPHREMRMNPKAITAPQMFGRLDVATNDWTDGIFSTLWRRTLKIKKTENVWLTLDGPVDAVWIENLNSVLDDNKTLTLANGDRITMAPNCKLVFEPDNVDNASPATVSRMGMVFMSASVLNWKPILEGWLKKRSKSEAETLRVLFEKIYDDLHSFVQIKLAAKMRILEAIYIRQTCDVLEGLLAPNDPDDPAPVFDKTHLERLVLFALMWSLGAVLELEDRDKMSEFVRKHASKLKWPKVQPDETIFEYVVAENGQWEHWRERVADYIYPSDSVPEYSSILVPNVDNVRTAFLIELIAKQSKAVLLIGEQGTAKTVMIKSFMSQYDPEYHLSKSLNFSSATTPNMFQRTIESYVEKRVGTTYGPPSQRKMTVFVDDINMPDINEWGDQITNEIVRQMMESKGFFSLDKPGDFSTILDIQMLGAMIHPGGGRNDIPPRLKRQFCIFNCALPSNASMDQIFSVIGTGYFCATRFNPLIVEFVPLLVSLTRLLWQKTKTKMLPTPAKFHYVFNLRDLSRIWEGLLKIKSDECQSVSTVLKLWCHECSRVIADRFTNYEDRDWFTDAMKSVAQENLESYFDQYPDEKTYFVDFLKDPPDPTGDEPDDFVIEMPFLYEEIHSYEETTERVLSFMMQYNEQVRGAAMDLVFFKDALVHLMIIYRILRTPRGNALLVGVGGSGKQSLTKLASFIAGYKIYQIQLTRNYNITNLMEDLKYLYKVAGFEGHGITFIFTDNDIKDESFLEYLNNVLSSGEIANLFPKDEMDEITSALVPVMKKVSPKRVPTQDNLYDFFISRARANLHVVLCFSPVGEKFRNRSLKFPGLISGCTVDWFQKWPKDALIAVSRHFLQDFPIVCTADVKKEIIELMAFVQDIVSNFCNLYFERFRRQVHVTPKSFLSFLDGYKKIYSQKHEQIKSMAARMETGLIKLVEATAAVDTLKTELVEMNKKIVVANEAAGKVLESVQVSREAAETVKSEVLAVKEVAENLVEVITAEKAIAEDKLAAARPAMEEAEAALKTVKPADIATVRKLGKPPYLITLIMDVVMILFRKRIDPVNPDFARQFLMSSWSEALRVMADTRFLARIVDYQTDLINAEMIDLMKPYFDYNLYTYEDAKVACGNVAGLLQWTKAMAKFYEVNKDVLPLKANLARQQVKLGKAAADLGQAQEQLHEKEMEVAEVEKKFDFAMAKKQIVLDQAQACQSKMDAATALISGLAGERVRWTEQSAQFKSEIERLVGDVLLFTGFLSYTGPFNQEFRNNLQKFWHDELKKKRIPVSARIDIVESLTDSATVSEWNLQGLPNDELSVQNGIIVTKADRFPLLIDPQSQGKLWIRSKEKDHQLIVTSLNHKYFRNHIEDCVQLGYPMLIEDIGEELDPMLDNILEKNFIKVGKAFKVKVGDKEVEVHNDFRMYMTTKLPNPLYTPEISARTSIIDFTVTIIGLEDQLLGRVILTEKRELETERTNLITSVTANKRKMQELEANLLHKLSTVEGSLLDDVSVITVLNVSKATSTEVQQKLVVARETEVKINAAREEFRPVATRGSVLYFLICTMSSVNHMYQTSLMQFLERFDLSMVNSTKSPITYKRIASIIDYLTYEVFKYKSRGLYEVHKYLFVLLMALNIDMQKEVVTHEEFQNFIKGGAALDINQCPAKPFKWITDITWLNLVQLSILRQFSKLTNQVTNNERAWKVWFDKAAPEEEPLPDGYQSLDPFRRLLLIRAWCPDRTLSQCRKYLAASLGAKYSDPVILNFDTMLEESRPLTPLICFLTMGSDPTPSIEALARRNGLKVRAISMGQGQEIHARKLMSKALEDGFWVLLQNCHLGLDYMNELVLLIMELEKKPEGVHTDFRLWMTTEENDRFPITLLQLCVKFTNEPPSGVRAGLKRTYGAMTLEMFEYSESPFYLPLIFAVSFLHTVVQERRKFGALGWNIPYEFNSADWLASCMFIQNHLEDLDPVRGISWSTVRYMLGEVQYGGRVTDDYDKRLLNTCTNVWFLTEMFAEEFEFFKGYKILNFKTLEEYMEAFEGMPTVDPPQVYGLHRNADITYQSNTTQLILNTILSVQPKESSGGGGETRESVVGRLAKEMLDKVPKSYDPFEVMERLRIMGHLNSMNIFLRQEIDRIQKIIKLVRTTLTDLLLAIEGTIIMNEQLRDALDNIYDARVPNIWKRLSWASSTLGFWFTELIERNKQFYGWCFSGRPNMFWMTGFFNPQGFLTAMRQEVARAHKGWALDVVTLHNDVTKMLTEECRVAPKEGVYVYGLYLDGAGWNRRTNCLQEALNKVVYTIMPVIHVYAINSTAPKDKQLYECPVYKKPNRTDLNFITPLWVQTQKPPDHWTLRGVALLCDIK